MFGKREGINLVGLRTGTTFKYNNTLWEIIEISDYDWGVDGKSIEYKIRSKNNIEAFLEVERHQGDYELYYSEGIHLSEEVVADGVSSKFIIHDGKEFELEEQYRGSCKNQTLGGSWEKTETYMFYAHDKTILTIEKINNTDLSAYYGSEVKEKALKNIKPN
ncbi:DUF4178 domain-containing protein [Dokdonia sp.]|uniref:DUF4178 domain-containing protein n=1 Tax=Dokdonia sp. TaxID=2024995 RepID=UPI0032666677